MVTRGWFVSDPRPKNYFFLIIIFDDELNEVIILILLHMDKRAYKIFMKKNSNSVKGTIKNILLSLAQFNLTSEA
jgi:hypothetical protein